MRIPRRFEVVEYGNGEWLLRQIDGVLQLRLTNMTNTEAERVAAFVESTFAFGRMDAQRDIRRSLGFTP